MKALRRKIATTLVKLAQWIYPPRFLIEDFLQKQGQLEKFTTLLQKEIIGKNKPHFLN